MDTNETYPCLKWADNPWFFIVRASELRVCMNAHAFIIVATIHHNRLNGIAIGSLSTEKDGSIPREFKSLKEAQDTLQREYLEDVRTGLNNVELLSDALKKNDLSSDIKEGFPPELVFKTKAELQSKFSRISDTMRILLAKYPISETIPNPPQDSE